MIFALLYFSLANAFSQKVKIQLAPTSGGGTVAVETDPIYAQSQAKNIVNSGSNSVISVTERNNLSTVYGWGNHAGLYESAFAKIQASIKRLAQQQEQYQKAITHIHLLVLPHVQH